MAQPSQESPLPATATRTTAAEHSDHDHLAETGHDDHDHDHDHGHVAAAEHGHNHAHGHMAEVEHDDHDHDHAAAHEHDLAGEHGAGIARWLPSGQRRELLLLGVSGVCLGVGLAAELLGGPEPLRIGLFLVAIMAGAVEIVPRGLRGVWLERSLDINFLVTVAVAGAMGLGQWAEGATVVFLFSLGETLESLTLARTRRSIQALMAMAPDTAQVKRPDGSEATQPVEQVVVGATVVVRPGDRIPLDGEVVAGHSAVDQAPITGESVPVEKAPGATVYAGTINRQGYLEVRTTKPLAENTLAKIIHLVEAAQSKKAPSQRLVERFARIYTPVVVIGAVLLTLIPPLIFGEPLVPWFHRSLVLLLVACPCALVISTPVTVVAAIGNASRRGVLVKGGAYLERAGTVRVVAFDKTGTLTRGVPEVVTVTPCADLSAADVVRLAAAAEARSEHPLAQAVVRAGRRLSAETPIGSTATAFTLSIAHISLRFAADETLSVSDFEAIPGRGIRAVVGRWLLWVGSLDWLRANGFDPAEVTERLAAITAAGQTPILVGQQDDRASAPTEHAGAAVERRWLLGIIAVADEVRPLAAETVATLREQGVRRVALLSGDNTVTAQAVARQVGIAPEDVRAELLPAEKLAAIQDYARSEGHVAMVGDGVNDAPALAAATVGIALGTGSSDTALEAADVALVADDLSRLPWVLHLSRRAARTIRFNVGFALLTKLLALGLGALGIANLWSAIAADTGASIVVILNGMRLIGNQRFSAGSAASGAALRRRFGLSARTDHHGHSH